MSTNFELNAKARDVFGTNASRRLRRLDQVPAMIYGGDQDNEAVLLDHHEIMHNLEVEAFHSAIISLNTGSGSQQVILREVQHHRYRPRLVHVDFQRIKATERLHMKIPLHFAGVDEAPGVKVEEGIFSPLMTELDVTCLPKDLPEYIEIDVSALGINDVIHLSSVELPEGVDLTVVPHEGEDPSVVTVMPPRTIEEEVLEAEDGVEVVEVEEGAASATGESAGDADSSKEKAEE
ncbi:MAG TPA: 50S ribosomal protein L25/general stress protein Ctc [Gammaproteobacteria bacterium]|jgi:large subunit ribosomal protein L25|nr:MAG: 50S ribosomal protein L25/general stress protein Ctc [Acidithiobacillus sp.]RTZ62878.1 MAG: 50S ribosomal protein L25 [Gammaproteobacteria bacterium]HAD36617.1 50S ribosomal protein L25 [Gammaproteobacteria bacterium]HBK75344.1 50S ribosomal protein L25 [Gammaproteobacteria bacterium]HIA41111.1 50S ribosomal protein L25/general stress protein Ctc [Gammaproteobacteria bacterium]